MMLNINMIVNMVYKQAALAPRKLQAGRATATGVLLMIFCILECQAIYKAGDQVLVTRYARVKDGRITNGNPPRHAKIVNFWDKEDVDIQFLDGNKEPLNLRAVHIKPYVRPFRNGDKIQCCYDVDAPNREGTWRNAVITDASWEKYGEIFFFYTNKDEQHVGKVQCRRTKYLRHRSADPIIVNQDDEKNQSQPGANAGEADHKLLEDVVEPGANVVEMHVDYYTGSNRFGKTYSCGDSDHKIGGKLKLSNGKIWFIYNNGEGQHRLDFDGDLKRDYVFECNQTGYNNWTQFKIIGHQWENVRQSGDAPPQFMVDDISQHNRNATTFMHRNSEFGFKFRTTDEDGMREFVKALKDNRIRVSRRLSGRCQRRRLLRALRLAA